MSKFGLPGFTESIGEFIGTAREGCQVSGDRCTSLLERQTGHLEALNRCYEKTS